MSELSAHAIFNLAIGADQTGPAKATGDTTLNFFGANLTGGSAAATLTVFDGAAAGAVVLMTLGAAIGANAGGVLPSFSVVKAGFIHYTMAGTGATGQIYWQTG